MSVASGYVHISVRNAQNRAGLRPASGRRSAPAVRPAAAPGGAALPRASCGSGPVATPVPPTRTTAPTPVIAPNGIPGPQAVANDNVARGFVLYMGIDEETAAAAGTSMAKLAQQIRAYAQSPGRGRRELRGRGPCPGRCPGRASTSSARPSATPPSAAARARGGRDPAPPQQPQSRRPSGVLIDLARREVHLDGESLNLTFKEFELLNYLVENGTRTVGRDELLRRPVAERRRGAQRAHHRRPHPPASVQAGPPRQHRAHRARPGLPVLRAPRSRCLGRSGILDLVFPPFAPRPRILRKPGCLFLSPHHLFRSCLRCYRPYFSRRRSQTSLMVG